MSESKGFTEGICITSWELWLCVSGVVVDVSKWVMCRIPAQQCRVLSGFGDAQCPGLNCNLERCHCSQPVCSVPCLSWLKGCVVNQKHMITASQMFWWQARALHCSEGFYIYPRFLFFSHCCSCNCCCNWYELLIKELWLPQVMLRSLLHCSLLYYSVAPPPLCACGCYSLKVSLCSPPLPLSHVVSSPVCSMISLKSGIFSNRQQQICRALPSPGNRAEHTSGFT